MNTTEHQHKTLALRDNRLFERIAAGHLNELATLAQRRMMPERTIIVEKGDAGDEMFAIVSGRVAVTSMAPDGKELILGYLGPGDICGEIAILDAGPRTATVTAIEPCEVLVFRRDGFLRFLHACPDVAVKFLELLAARLRATDQTLEDSTLRQLPTRLARRLLGLAVGFGQPTMNGIKIPIKLSQQDIGNLTGATRESVNRQLREWETQGWIALERGFITIIDKRQIASVAD